MARGSAAGKRIYQLRGITRPGGVRRGGVTAGRDLRLLVSVELEGKWPVLARHERAAEWDAYGR